MQVTNRPKLSMASVPPKLRRRRVPRAATVAIAAPTSPTSAEPAERHSLVRLGEQPRRPSAATPAGERRSDRQDGEPGSIGRNREPASSTAPPPSLRRCIRVAVGRRRRARRAATRARALWCMRLDVAPSTDGSIGCRNGVRADAHHERSSRRSARAPATRAAADPRAVAFFSLVTGPKITRWNIHSM